MASKLEEPQSVCVCVSFYILTKTLHSLISSVKRHSRSNQNKLKLPQSSAEECEVRTEGIGNKRGKQAREPRKGTGAREQAEETFSHP